MSLKSVFWASMRLLLFYVYAEWKPLVLTREQSRRLKQNIPKLLKIWNDKMYNPKERIWDLKRRIRVNTYTSQKPLSVNLLSEQAPNLLCMPPPEMAQSLMVPAKRALDHLFGHILDANSKLIHGLPFQVNHTLIQDYKSRGLVYFPNNSLHEYETEGRCVLPMQFRQFLRSDSKSIVIDRLWAIYQKHIIANLLLANDLDMSHYDAIENFVNEHGTLYVLKYKAGTGIWMHIDNLLRSDATVYTIGIGRDVIYDMAPIIKQQRDACIFRTHQKEGTMMVLDGDARYKWAHGIPHDRSKKNGTKYTIILRLFHHEALTEYVGKCHELQTEMYSMRHSS